MKKCLLKGFFGHRNLGDDLLYEESISKIPSEYHIYTNGNCPYPEDLKRENVTLVHSFREILSHKYDLTIINGGYSPSVRYSWTSLIRDILIRFRSRKMVINGVGLAPKIGTWNRLRYKMFLKMLDYRSVIILVQTGMHFYGHQIPPVKGQGHWQKKFWRTVNKNRRILLVLNK